MNQVRLSVKLVSLSLLFFNPIFLFGQIPFILTADPLESRETFGDDVFLVTLDSCVVCLWAFTFVLSAGSEL